MKIRLKHDIPVENKHGMTKGRVFEVDLPFELREYDLLEVKGDVGETVSLQWHEYEEVKEQ